MADSDFVLGYGMVEPRRVGGDATGQDVNQSGP